MKSRRFVALDREDPSFAEKREGWGTLKFKCAWRNRLNKELTQCSRWTQSAQRRGTQDPGTHSVPGAHGEYQVAI